MAAQASGRGGCPVGGERTSPDRERTQRACCRRWNPEDSPLVATQGPGYHRRVRSGREVDSGRLRRRAGTAGRRPDRTDRASVEASGVGGPRRRVGGVLPGRAESAGAANRQAILRDVATGRTVHGWKIGSRITAVAYSPDGRRPSSDRVRMTWLLDLRSHLGGSFSTYGPVITVSSSASMSACRLERRPHGYPLQHNMSTRRPKRTSRRNPVTRSRSASDCSKGSPPVIVTPSTSSSGFIERQTADPAEYGACRNGRALARVPGMSGAAPWAAYRAALKPDVDTRAEAKNRDRPLEGLNSQQNAPPGYHMCRPAR